MATSELNRQLGDGGDLDRLSSGFSSKLPAEDVAKDRHQSSCGSSLDAACFVSNMSPDAIYIESVILELTYGEETFDSAVTDFKATKEDGDDQNAKHRTFQGPLAPSAYTSLATFRCLLESLSERTGCDMDPFRLANSPILIDVSIFADYASERHLIGAKRRFRATPEAGHWTLAGEALETQQIRSYTNRH